jgi:hypothetical protein
MRAVRAKLLRTASSSGVELYLRVSLIWRDGVRPVWDLRGQSAFSLTSKPPLFHHTFDTDRSRCSCNTLASQAPTPRSNGHRRHRSHHHDRRNTPRFPDSRQKSNRVLLKPPHNPGTAPQASPFPGFPWSPSAPIHQHGGLKGNACARNAYTIQFVELQAPLLPISPSSPDLFQAHGR